MKNKKYHPGYLENIMFFGDFVDISMRLSDLEGLLNETDKYFKNRIKDRKSENYLDFREYEIEKFPDIQRISFLIVLVMLIEIQIKSYCNNLYRFRVSPIKLNKLRGSIIEQFLVYVEKLAGYDFAFEEGILDRIREIIELRNCFVHADGYLKEFNRREQIKNLSRKVNGIIIANGYVELSSESCLEFIKIVRKFFDIIYNKALELFPKVDYD